VVPADFDVLGVLVEKAAGSNVLMSDLKSTLPGGGPLFAAVRYGAVAGALTWLIYAIVECVVLVILPWFTRPHYEYHALSSGFTALLFLLYPAIGGFLGGLAALALRVAANAVPALRRVPLPVLLPAMAVFSVVVIHLLILLHYGDVNLGIAPSLAIGGMVALAAVASALSAQWRKRLLFLANPWTASLLLVGVPFVTEEFWSEKSELVKVSAALAATITILLLSRLMQAQLERRRRQGWGHSAKAGLVLASLAALLAGISCFPSQEVRVLPPPSGLSHPGPRQPNVILITLDTVRADHLSAYGYGRDTTPALKKFAEEAVLYRNAVAPADFTLPSHASLFTGLYASTHGAYITPQAVGGRPLDSRFQTLAEILSKKGYFTAAVVANTLFLDAKYDLDQGFQYYDFRSPVSFWTEPLDMHSIRFGVTRLLRTWWLEFRRAADINREAAQVLDRARRRPFLLFLNYMDAHHPYEPPPPFDTLFPGKDPSFRRHVYGRLFFRVLSGGKLTERERDHLISQYDGGIAYLDSNLGRLFSELKRRALYDNSLIIVTSDHGEAFGLHGLMGHAGISVYQNLIRIPLLIKYPHQSRAKVVNETVSLVDVLPTILNVLHYANPKDIEGQSLLAARDNGAISECYPVMYSIPRLNRIERAIISGNMKLITSDRGRRELYDLAKDPSESHNLFATDDRGQKLEARLDNWLALIKPRLRHALPVGRQQLDRLKSLGYLQ
jgi:arylsulfatase A-like enzyme